jgi:hypothetical protein
MKVNKGAGVAMFVLAVAVIFADVAPSAESRRAVTVQELFDAAHRIEVSTGTAVVWADPHFDRVWFPSGRPPVQRTAAGLITVFDEPGEYRGRFTVVGPAHGASDDVFTVTVVVRTPPA